MSATSSEPPADDTALGRLIARVDDPELRKGLTREVALVRDSRAFGLVFDRHLPESARLPKHPIGPGMTVVRREDESDAVLRVVGIDGEVAQLDDGSEEVLAQLVVFRDFGDAVHPGLRSVDRLDRGAPGAPWHTVINGENLHALQMLRQTHAGLIDLIYIDPPYNTGNEGWIYNDRYVDPNDRARSSKWLSFMERRLKIARSLLKPTGVIIVAIGDDEHHRLRMLMDQVVGPQNFIANVVWFGGRQNDARFVSVSTDHMLIYARAAQDMLAVDVRWREAKLGADLARRTAVGMLERADGDAAVATELYRRWQKSIPAGDMGEGVRRFNRVESGTGRLFNDDKDLSAPEERPNRSRRPLIHPTTGRSTPVPTRGWALSDQEMDRRVAEGLVVFGADENKIPRGKAYLDDSFDQVAGNVFERDRNQASRSLQKVLGDKRFPYPKDHEVLMRWIRLAAPNDAVILDFFGGSGTTTEAVLRLNAEDGGTRQSILVTNNEVGSKKAKELRKAGHHPGDPEWEAFGVFEHVTRPRITTVVTGERPDGSTYSDGVEANVELFDLAYLDPSEVRRGREFESIAPILWLKAGATGDRIDSEPEADWALAENYGVLFDIDALKPFADAVTERAKADDLPGLIFVVTDSPAEARLVGERLPSGCRVHQLYESHVQRFSLGVDEDGS